MNAQDCIVTRRSVRKFTAQPVAHETLEKVVSLALEAGFSPLGLTYSPVKGPEGNIEYLLYLRRDESPQAGALPDIAALVEESHSKLNGGDSA